MRCFQAVTLLLILNNIAWAQWSNDPSQNLKVAAGAINHQICADGAGGCYIAWETGAAPNRRLLRIQRLDRFGFKQFAEQGMPIRAGEFDQANLKLFEDGQGGAIIVFNELLPVADTLLAIAYAQRIDNAGTRVWGDSAVVVSPSPAHQIPLAACGDGTGGAFIFWSEDRNRDGNEELYGARIDAAGEHPLGEDGVLIVESNIETRVDAVSIGGSQIVLSYSKNIDIIVQKFDAELIPLWGEGVTNLGLPLRANYRKMIADGTDGVVLTSKSDSFFDQQSFFKLWAQRIDSLGNVVWNGGVVLADSVKDPTWAPHITIDLPQTIYFTWEENQNGTVEVFIQRFDFSGRQIWKTKLPVSKLHSSKTFTNTTIISDDRVIVIWLDYRNGQFDLFGQLIDNDQRRLWTDSDIALSVRSDTQSDPAAVSDDYGGAIIAWNELGAGTGNGVFAQQVSRSGKLGDVIVSVREPNTEPIPSSFQLLQSYPNPFNPTTNIAFTLPVKSRVKLTIYNVAGKEVTTLLDKPMPPGRHVLRWHGADRLGKNVSSGVYFYKLLARGSGTGSIFTESRKMLLLR